ERLGVLERERREAGECIQGGLVGLRQRVALASQAGDDAADLSADLDRRDEHVGELAVRARAAHDPALGDGLRAEPARPLLPADALRIAAADGAAGKEVALALERP